MEERRFIKVGGLCGILGVLLYIGLAVSDQFIFPETRSTQEFLSLIGTTKYGAINMGMHFVFVAVVMLWIVAFLSLNRLLGADNPGLTLRLGTLFGIIACAIMAQMMIVQASVMVRMGRMLLATTDDAQRQNLVAMYKGLRYIDYGMDLAFDSFFFTAWIMLGYNMLYHARYGKVFGIIGIILFGLAAILNLQTAPDPPNFDVGPIASLWILAVYVQMVRAAKPLTELHARESLA